MSTKNTIKYLNIFILFYMFMSFVFSRSFVGIYIFGYRIGEIAVGSTAIIFLFLLFFNSTYLNTVIFEKNMKFIILMLFLSFIIVALSSQSNFFLPYTYKASSFIWVFSVFFLGAHSKKINLGVKFIFIIEFILISIFFVSIYGLPEILVELFLIYSDKYEPHKGSDLGLYLIVVNLLIINQYKNNRFSLNLFVVNLGFFLPLILYRSRGAFIGVIIFVIYQFYLFFKKDILFVKKNIPLLIIFLILATYSTLVSQVKDFPEEVSAEVIYSSYSSLGEFRLQHYQEDYPIIYIENGRVYSGDGNLNWRLSMWQDQIDFMIKQNMTLLGSGYNERLYVFTTNNTGYGNDRTGLDNTNENVHNFFLQVFSRGGFLQLFIYIFIFSYIFKIYFSATKSKDILFFIFPLIWISLFDSSMENAHFPIIFYYILGNFYFTNIPNYRK